MRENALATVEPAVRAPGKCVQGFVGVLVSPAIQQNFRRTGGLRFVTVLNRNEHQVGSSADPYAAESDLQATDQIEAFHENRAAIKFSIAVRVFENQNAILAFALG